MTMTTIKVPSETRDRLKAQAAAAHRSLGAHLDALADLADRQTRFATLKGAIAATSPSDRATYDSETAAWERVEWSDDADER